MPCRELASQCYCSEGSAATWRRPTLQRHPRAQCPCICAKLLPGCCPSDPAQRRRPSCKQRVPGLSLSGQQSTHVACACLSTIHRISLRVYMQTVIHAPSTLQSRTDAPVDPTCPRPEAQFVAETSLLCLRAADMKGSTTSAQTTSNMAKMKAYCLRRTGHCLHIQYHWCHCGSPLRYLSAL